MSRITSKKQTVGVVKVNQSCGIDYAQENSIQDEISVQTPDLSHIAPSVRDPGTLTEMEFEENNQTQISIERFSANCSRQLNHDEMQNQDLESDGQIYDSGGQS